VARNLFDKLPLGSSIKKSDGGGLEYSPFETGRSSNPTSASNTPRDILYPEHAGGFGRKEGNREVENVSRRCLHVAASAADAAERSSTPAGIRAADLTSSPGGNVGWEEPVSPDERNWWMGSATGGMVGGIARFMRSSQRAVANLRTSASSRQYSQIGSISHSPEVSPQKQPKRVRDSPSNLKDVLERSAFGQSMSPSFDSIQRPSNESRILSNKASLNEFVGISAQAGFYKAEPDAAAWADEAGSPRSRHPPPLPHPERKSEGLKENQKADPKTAPGKPPTFPDSPKPNARDNSPQVEILVARQSCSQKHTTKANTDSLQRTPPHSLVLSLSLSLHP
jgi:hypothetical protein